jgi:hypothetical protein
MKKGDSPEAIEDIVQKFSLCEQCCVRTARNCREKIATAQSASPTQDHNLRFLTCESAVANHSSACGKYVALIDAPNSVVVSPREIRFLPSFGHLPWEAYLTLPCRFFTSPYHGFMRSVGEKRI